MKKKIGIVLTSAVALVLALVLLLNPAATITAQAISLDHIETIKQEKAASNSGFLIVEVAPSAEDGTIGYYVANQEPVANWPEKAAAISGKAARTSAVNAVFQSLRDKGLLSGGDSTPLTDLGSYVEFYPWEAYPEEASPLSLNQAEEVDVTGSFTKVSSGDYDANIRYSLDIENGTALQIVSYFEYASETTPGEYYYALDFTPIEAGSDLADGTPVYRGTLLTESSTESAEPEITEEEVLNSDGSEFPTEPQVTVSEPETETDGNTTRITTVKTTVSYAVEPIMWKYIDPLTGEEVVPPASGTDTDTETNTEEPSEPVEVVVAVRVTTTTVRETTIETTTLGICQYEGIVGQGLSLDLDEHYYTVSETADSVPSETRTESHCYRAEGLGFAEGENGSGYFRADIESYYYIGSGRGSYDFAQDPTGSYSGTISCDTVYYAGGFTNNNWFRNYALDCTETETFPVLVRSYSPSELTSRLTLLETADLIVVSSGLSGTAYQLPAALKSAIDEAVGQGTPLLTDSTMAGSLSSLTVGIASGGVKENVYVYSGTSIANAAFHTRLDTQLYLPESSPYRAVYQEISYENELRAREGVSALPEIVSEATCLRYIINYAGHRVENKKTTLRVLDIEPMTSSAGITKADVKSWLPENSFTDANITITTMAVCELIGSIEDISECYDLIYVGSSAANTASYLDTDFLYANIGRTYTVGSSLRWDTYGSTARFSGNDLNAAKLSELLSYADNGCPVILADNLVQEGRAASTLTFSATATGEIVTNGNNSNNTYANLTAVLNTSLPTGAVISYQWYQGTRAISGATSATYRTDRLNRGALNTNYYCVVRVTYLGYTASAATNTLRPEYGNTSYTIRITQTAANRDNYLYSASVTPAISGINYSWQHRNWYNITYSFLGRNASQESNRSYLFLQVTFPDGSQEDCYFNRDDRFPQTFTHSMLAYVVSDRGGMEEGQINIAGIEGGINKTHVDTASQWYSLLSSIQDKDNVFSVKDAKNQQDKVLKAVNLSQPLLTITGDRQYQESNPVGTSLTDRTLTAYFTIDNPTDATPGSTRYYAYFYIDKNADGKFSDDELLSDTSFYNASGSMVSSGSLKAGEPYHINRRFASTYTGIIPWKLEVVKVGQSGAHASDIHYAYIHPAAAKTLRVLQICNGGNSVTTFSGGSGSVYRSNVFNSISGVSVTQHPTDANRLEMKIKDDFILDLSILNVDMVNNFSNGTRNSYINALISEFYGDGYVPTVSELLQQFDMVILGFGDMYGNFNQTSARAVVDFIDTGKAILFCHDTTSFHNYSTTGWGYQFNKVDRDAVGLDRYGATGQGSSANHTIAYLPGTNTRVNTIQGYTSHTMERFRTNNDGGTKTTTTVTKVNNGQITSYPFALGNSISTKTTHDQYYQLNLTGDDVTVWYCLGGSNYSSIKNDCLNAYYIYNKGNVTYTGAGHTNDFTTDEAKLFINTMIAAYRAAASAPEFSFRRSDDSTDQSYLLLTQEQTADESGNISAAIVPGQKVYFKVIDTNIASSLNISANFWYQDGAEKVLLRPTVVRSGAGTVSGSLQSYVLYEFELPDELLDTLNHSATGTLKLYGQAVTTIGAADYTSATGSIELRVAQQLNLS